MKKVSYFHPMKIIYSKSIITANTVTDMLGMIDPVFMENLFDIILNKEDIRPIVESLESYEVGQVLDEISIYLKQKMLLNDIKYDLYIFDRFFRIIADSKQLLNMNSDGGFVLILTLSKMVEAVNLKKIDDVINDVQNLKVTEDIKKVLEPMVEKTSSEHIKIDIEEEVVVIPETIEDSSETLFKKLVENIYNKSFDLGECFEKSFIFSSYENNILKINSSAVGDCKALLYKNFSHIKIFVVEVFGENTELEFEKIKKEQTKEMARIVQPSNNNEVSSMIEDIELHEEMPSSCVAGMSEMTNPNLSQVELNIDDVLNSKMTNTAVQLLQPRNPLKIKSKL